MAQTTAILQAEFETAGRAKAIHRRRQHREGHGVLDLTQRSVGAIGNRAGSIVTATFRPILERRKRQRRILPATGEAETQDHYAVTDPRLTGVVRFELFGYLHGAVLGRARRQLDIGNGVALIFCRQKRRRQARKTEPKSNQQDDVDHQVATGALQRIADPTLIAIGQLLETTIEPAKESGLLVMLTFGDRLEQCCAQRRRQRQGEKRREQNRRGHGQRELLVDHADRALHERHRNKHRDQHQGDADNRAGNLRHCLARGFLGRQALAGHDALDVLHHNDRVIHQNADGQHHAEHGQHVDREAQRQHSRERTHQRHRHHQRRDQRVAHVLQEQEHHRKHQQHRFAKGVDHFGDRDFDEGRGVVRNLVLHAGREVARQLVHLRPHQRCGVQCVGAGRQLNADGGGRLAVQASAELIFLTADFDARDITDAHRGAVAIGLEHDVGEFLRRR